MPSDSEIVGSIFGIVSSTPLDQLTAKKVRVQVETMYGISLAGRKDWFRDQVTACLTRIQRRNNGEDIESESEGVSSLDPDSESSEPPAPTPAVKPTKAKASSSKKGKGKGKVPSTQLAALIGAAATDGTPLNNFSVTKYLWAYIKEHELQDPAMKRRILCDDKFRALTKQDSVDSFTMAKYVSQHLLDADTPINQRTIKVQPVAASEGKSVKKEANKKKGEKAESGRKRKASTSSSDPSSTSTAESRAPVFSDALAAVTNGVRRGNNFAVTKLLWAYIKEHDLQDPKDRRTIVCDEKLAAVMGKERVPMMQMAGLIRKHLIPFDEFVAKYGADEVPSS
jgi:upstream activation factor subunit UAF30